LQAADPRLGDVPDSGTAMADAAAVSAPSAADAPVDEALCASADVKPAPGDRLTLHVPANPNQCQ